jgi:4-carboxymuconolactone decarboxylase
MKTLAATLASLFLVASSSAEAEQPNVAGRRLSPEDVRRVAPGLEKYTQDRLYGEVWKRPGLSRRDRSIVTVAALIARNQTLPMNYYFGQALDNGLKPSELSEIITHLAFYSGFGNAFAAIAPARDIFAERGIGPDQAPAASPRFYRSTKLPRPTARRASASSSARSLRASCSTRPTFSSLTYGSGRISRPATEALSRSAP